jgi:hypothetical protein
MGLRHRPATRVGAYALLVALVACVAACGGDADDPKAEGFTASATVDCAKSRERVRDVNTSPESRGLSPESLVLSDAPIDLTSPPISASEGGFTLDFDSGNSVVISFHTTMADAELEVAAFRLAAREFGVELAQRKANATLAWSKSPSRAEAGLVEGCLSKGGGPIPIYEQDPSFATSYRYTDEEYAAWMSTCQDAFGVSVCTCFLEWAQERYSATYLVLLRSNEDPVRAVLDHCGRK